MNWAMTVGESSAADLSGYLPGNAEDGWRRRGRHNRSPPSDLSPRSRARTDGRLVCAASGVARITEFDHRLRLRLAVR